MSDKELMELARKRAFYVHLTVCTTITILLVIIYFVISFGESFWPIWPIIGLVMGIVLHAMTFSSIFNGDDKVREEYNSLKKMYNSEKLQ